VTTKKHVDNVLSQIVDVALDRAQQDASRSLTRDLAFYYGLDQFHHPAKDLACHNESGQEVFSLLVAQTHLAHPFLTVFDNQQRVITGFQSLTDKVKGRVFLKISDGGDQYRARV
jgi:hypothetical protein